jgi:hypothetical protein
MIIPAQNLLVPFSNQPRLPKNFVISDANYLCPRIETVTNIIYPAYVWWLRSLKLSRWTHKWDCDNFADAFKLFSCGYHHQNLQGDAEGIGVGVINYMANSKAEDGLKGGHAINIIYAENNKNDDNMSEFDVYFLEPQNGKLYSLTTEEFNSIWTVYI